MKTSESYALKGNILFLEENLEFISRLFKKNGAKIKQIIYRKDNFFYIFKTKKEYINSYNKNEKVFSLNNFLKECSIKKKRYCIKFIENSKIFSFFNKGYSILGLFSNTGIPEIIIVLKIIDKDFEKKFSYFFEFMLNMLKNYHKYEEIKDNSLNSYTEMQAMLDGIAKGIIITDFDNIIKNVNQKALEILGIEKNAFDLYQKPFETIINHEELSRFVIETFDNPLKTFEKELTIFTDHDKRILNTKSRIMETIYGEPLGIVTVLRDITNEKEAERSKDNFLSVVSHELRTPLTSIKGFASLTLMEKFGSLGEEYKHFLSIILRQTDNLIGLVNNLLEVSRMDDGIKRQIVTEEINIRDFIREITENYKSLIISKKISFMTEIDDNVKNIYSDRERLERVLINLISNAVKFSNKNGDIILKIMKSNNDILFSVKDFGCGIKDKEIKKIFDKFYQVEDGLSRHIGGSGLGLFIVKDIVENIFGGSIWVKSIPHKGSEFFFTMKEKPLEG